MTNGLHYTSVEEAGAEIERRFADVALRKEVEEFLGDDLIVPFAPRPHAFFVRFIATPDNACMRFTSLARSMGVTPVFLENHSAVFSSSNADKWQLVRTLVYGVDGELRYLQVCGRRSSNGRRVADLRSFDGRSLVEFHHVLMNRALPSVNVNDATTWFERFKNASEYYPPLLAHCIAHAVQVEYYDFYHSEQEAAWVAKVIVPAFENAKRRFGLDPLIVNLCPENPDDEAFDRSFRTYPEVINQELLSVIEDHGVRTFPYSRTEAGHE